MSTVSLVPLAVDTSPVFEVDTGSFLAIVATAAVAGTLGGRRRWARPLPARGRSRADARRARRAAGARPRPRQRLHGVLQRPRPRHAVLLRRLRDRPGPHPRDAAASGRIRLGDVARDRLHPGRRACRRRRGRVAGLRRVRPGDDGDRDPAAGPLGHRRDAYQVRHVPAGRRRRRRVRPDPAAHARPLDPERAAQRADPDRVRPAGRRRRGRRGPLVAADARPVRAHGRDERAAGGALDRRARLRAGAAGQQARARPPARRVRRRRDQPAGAGEVGDGGVRLEAHRDRLRLLRALLLRGERDAARRGRPLRQPVRRREARRCSSCSSSSSAGRRRCCSTAASCRSGRTASRSHSSVRRSCRSWWRSRRSRSRTATCARRPPRRWWGQARCRRWRGRCTACGCDGSPRRSAPPRGEVEAGGLPAEAPVAP